MKFTTYTPFAVRHFLINLLLLTTIMGFSSCFLKNRHNNIKEEILEIQEEKSQITYVATYIIKVEKPKGVEQETFSLEKINKARGYLKTSKGFNNSEEENIYKVEFLDENKNIIATTTTRNPLTKHFEAPNESGKIESKTVTVTEDIIGVRVNYSPLITSMKFYKPAIPQPILLQELIISKE